MDLWTGVTVSESDKPCLVELQQLETKLKKEDKRGEEGILWLELCGAFGNTYTLFYLTTRFVTFKI